MYLSGGGDPGAGEGFGDRAKLDKARALDAAINQLVEAHGAHPPSPEAGAPESAGFLQAVRVNLLTMDQDFWVRIATRADSAESAEEKENLAGMAGRAMYAAEALVKEADAGAGNKAAVLQRILEAAADEAGVWDLPLRPERAGAMREAFKGCYDRGEVDESLLGTAFAWLRKCAEDGEQQVAALLQIVLQMYAAEASTTAGSGGEGAGAGEAAEAALNDFLRSDPASWDAQARDLVASTEGRAEGDAASWRMQVEMSLQRKMEAAVLNLPSGSHAQRVQAEFLKEADDRLRAAFGPDEAGGGEGLDVPATGR